MPRYRLHLNECGKVTADPDGLDRRSVNEVRTDALKAAREIMCAEIAEGRLCLSCRIDVTDDAGSVVLTVPFKDAVTITGA